MVAAGEQVDPVGKEAAGAVVLGTVDHPLVTLARDTGDDVANFHRTYLCPGAAHQIAFDEAFEPDVLRCAGMGIETILDKGEVPAQRLRHVGVGFGQLDQ
ncbi:hypothetical protein D3C79_939320 [compost metagenome]